MGVAREKEEQKRLIVVLDLLKERKKERKPEPGHAKLQIIASACPLWNLSALRIVTSIKGR